MAAGFYGLIIAVTGVALILSHSRAGIAACALGLIAFFAALAAGKRLVGRALGVYGGLVAVVAVVIVLVAGQAGQGVDRSVEGEERDVLFGYSVDAIADYPSKAQASAPGRRSSGSIAAKR